MTFAVPVALALILLLQPAGVSMLDFTGSWTMHEGRSDSAQQDKFVGPVTLVISRVDATLIVETRRGDQVEVRKFVVEPHA